MTNSEGVVVENRKAVKELVAILADDVIDQWQKVASEMTADTKEGYELVRKEIRLCVSKRTEIETARKILIKDALEWQRTVNAEASRLTERVSAIEAGLKEKKQRVDKEEEERKRQEELKKQAFINHRIATFVDKAGRPITVHEAEHWSCDQFNEALEKAMEEKRIADEEAERLALEEQARRDAFLAEQARLAEEEQRRRAEMEEEQAKLREAMRAIEAEKMEMERLRLEHEQKLQEEIDRQNAELEQLRMEKQMRIDAEERERLAKEQEEIEKQGRLQEESERAAARKTELEVFWQGAPVVEISIGDVNEDPFDVAINQDDVSDNVVVAECVKFDEVLKTMDAIIALGEEFSTQLAAIITCNPVLVDGFGDASSSIQNSVALMRNKFQQLR